MGAKGNTVLAAATLAMAALATVWPAAAEDSCSRMAVMRPEGIVEALNLFSPDVLGKPADLWGRADFENLLNHAAACDGKPEGMKYRVDAKFWEGQMNPAMERLLPFADRTAAVRAAYAPRWKWGDPPSCLQVLNWKRDPVWLTENSGEVFGKPLAEMDDEGRALAAGFSKECRPVMEAALQANRMDPSAALAIVNDVAAAAEREGEAAKEKPDDLAPALKVYHSGRQVPLAYIGKSSRKMVLIASGAEKAGRKLTTEELIMLSKWAEQIVMEETDSPERLYADAVRTVIGKHLFNAR